SCEIVMLPLLLAADVGNWIGLAILVLTVLGWIVNAIKGNDPEGKPLPNRQRQQPKRDLRSEIEVFLEELQQKPNAEPRQRPEPVRPAVAERPRVEKSRKANPPQPKPARAKGGNSGSSKGSGSKPRESVREHVSTFMSENRVGKDVQQHLAHRIDEAVEHDLAGGTVAPVAAVAPRASVPHPLLNLLSRPEGIRQAVLMNEILQRPRALRHRPGSSS
ncbi:MAG: hypothetical protein B7Z55_10310, partial [Planctomycetales bacterium 12-60-4]